MSDWSIELFENQIKYKSLAERFSNSFPQRSIIFFERMIRLLDNTNARLFLLVIDGKVKGATFAFKVTGYDYEVWSPSYLYVEQSHRSFSLLFIIGVLRKISTYIIDVSPTKDVRKILGAVKYKEYSKGSFMIPVLLGYGVKIFSKRYLIKSTSPFELFAYRRDLFWYHSKEDNSYFCIKKTSRYGVTFFILVYFNKKLLEKHIAELLLRVACINPFGMLLIPNVGQELRSVFIRLDKFHSYSNINNLGNVYSILGSEVTEAI